MTDEQIAKLEAEAAAEFDRGEELMVVSPLAVMGLVERLHQCLEERQAAARYDLLA